LAGLAYLYSNSGASYLPAWVTVIILALLMLAALSIPRFINISANTIEIHCLMELTTIPLDEIISIRRMEQKEMKWSAPIPLLGIYGIFGYYGYYINLKQFKIFKVYCRQWNNFIMIENIYEDNFVISADDPDLFIEEVQKRTNSTFS